MGYRWKHFLTVYKHRKIVRKECAACGIWWRGVTHDLSKYSPTEFNESAKHFQGNRSPIEAAKDAARYSMAWLHHKGRNPHHWEYWIDFNDEDGSLIFNKIPFVYVVEMICDWIGAGKVYGKETWTQHEPLKYYLKVRSGRHFAPETEALIMEFLNAIDKDGLEEFHRMAKCEGKYAYLQMDYDHPGLCP